MTDLFDELVGDNIRGLHPYQAGKPIEELERELGITGAVKIASNENPLGISPLALAAAERALRQGHLYPDPGQVALRRAIGASHGVGADEIIMGGGANELIHLFVRTFCRPKVDEVVAHANSFISYRLAAQVQDAPFVETPVTADLRCDVDALIAAFGPRTRIVFLANPNNPTGAYLGRTELERILEAAPPRALVIVDEAYHEFARALAPDYQTAHDYRTPDRPLLVVLRTFSKIYGLAGLRVGYGVCHPRLVDYVDRVRRPFNVGSVAQAAALAALGDHEHVARSTALAARAITALTGGLGRLGLRVYPSAANFVLVDVGRPAGPIYDQLLRRGVIVRPLAAWGLPHGLRVSIGTPEQCERAIAAFAAVVG